MNVLKIIMNPLLAFFTQPVILNVLIIVLIEDRLFMVFYFLSHQVFK